jgi:hypothetical protein
VLSRWLATFVGRTLLFGVEQRDPATFAAATLVLAGIERSSFLLVGYLRGKRNAVNQPGHRQRTLMAGSVRADNLDGCIHDLLKEAIELPRVRNRCTELLQARHGG